MNKTKASNSKSPQSKKKPADKKKEVNIIDVQSVEDEEENKQEKDSPIDIDPDAPKKSEAPKNLKSRKKQKDKDDEDDNDDGASPIEPGATGKSFRSKMNKSTRSRKDRGSEKANDGTGNFNGQSDFASFDILWYDLVTKTRALVNDLCSPLVEDITFHKDQLSKLTKTNDENVIKVDELERTVYNRSNRLTVFEEIYDKIAQVEAERIVVEQRIENDHELILKQFKEHEFVHENSQKQVDRVIKSSQEALAEMAVMKEAMVFQNKAFMESIDEVQQNVLDNSQEDRKNVNDMRSLISGLNVRSQDQKGNIDEIYQRMTKAETKIEDLNKFTIELGIKKCDQIDFLANKDSNFEMINQLEARVSETKNQCIQLDSYLDKYQPVRMQQMISDTLNACLTDEERRNHELYDNDKVALLYRLVLADTGKGNNIHKMIHEMTGLAKQVIDEEERQKRRHASLAGRQKGAKKPDFSKQQSPKKRQSPKVVKPQPVKAMEIEIESQVQDSQNETYRYWDPVNKAFKTSQSRPESAKEEDDKEEFTYHSGNPLTIKQQLELSGVASIIKDENNCDKLVDLLNSDFDMDVNDEDYALTSDELIKVCKILFHKINYNSRKTKLILNETNLEMKAKAEEVEMSMKSSSDEINHFLSNVHQDLENFLIKHKKEHQELNLKISKLSQVGHKTLDNVDQVRESVEKYATILSCLVEFDSIEQALAFQDEIDRNKAPLPEQSPVKMAKSQMSHHSKSPSFFPTYTEDIRTKMMSPNIVSNESLKNDQKSISKLSLKNESTLRIGYNDPKKNYNISKVTYRKMELSRDQLIEMRKTLLQKCEEVIQKMTWPFAKNNLKPEKIFLDLIQFHSSPSNLNIKTLTHDDSIAQSKAFNTMGVGALGRKASHQPFGKAKGSFYGGTTINSLASGQSMLSLHPYQQHQAKNRRNSGIEGTGMNLTQALNLKTHSSISYNPGVPMPMSVMANHIDPTKNVGTSASNHSVHAGQISLQNPQYYNQGWNVQSNANLNQQSKGLPSKMNTHENSPHVGKSSETQLKLPNI